MLLLRLLARLLSLTGIRGVGIILVDREGRFLLNHRDERLSRKDPEQKRARGYLRGRWAIFAGALESKETPEEAAVREIWEETGLLIQRLHLVVSVRRPRIVYLYAAGLTDKDAENLFLGEGREHRFVALDEVGGLSPRIPLLRPVLAAFAGTEQYQRCMEDARGGS